MEEGGRRKEEGGRRKEEGYSRAPSDPSITAHGDVKKRRAHEREVMTC